MRGGGTVFGVVTQLAFKVYDVSDYHGGIIMYENGSGEEWRRLCVPLFELTPLTTG